MIFSCSWGYQSMEKPRKVAIWKKKQWQISKYIVSMLYYLLFIVLFQSMPEFLHVQLWDLVLVVELSRNFAKDIRSTRTWPWLCHALLKSKFLKHSSLCIRKSTYPQVVSSYCHCNAFCHCLLTLTCLSKNVWRTHTEYLWVFLELWLPDLQRSLKPAWTQWELHTSWEVSFWLAIAKCRCSATKYLGFFFIFMFSVNTNRCHHLSTLNLKIKLIHTLQNHSSLLP